MKKVFLIILTLFATGVVSFNGSNSLQASSIESFSGYEVNSLDKGQVVYLFTQATLKIPAYKGMQWYTLYAEYAKGDLKLAYMGEKGGTVYYAISRAAGPVQILLLQSGF